MVEPRGGNVRIYICFCALFALSAALWARFHEFAFDDAFIIYRVAENLASGKGFVYNPGQRLNALTCPLYGVMLGALRWATGAPLPLLGSLVSAAGFFIGACFFGRLIEDEAGAAAGFIFAALLVANPFFLSFFGMESGLLVGVAGTALYAWLRGMDLLSGFLFGLCFLVRMDSALIFLFALVLTWRERSSSGRLRSLAVFSAVVGSWLLFSWLYFHEVLPHTLFVKKAQSMVPGHWGGPWKFAKELVHLGSILTGRFDPAFLVLVPCLILGFTTAAKRGGTTARALLLFAAGHAIAYSLVLRVPPYTWYFLPELLAYCLLVALGSARLVSLAEESKAVRWAFLGIPVFGIFIWAVLRGLGVLSGLGRALSPVHAFHAFVYFCLLASYRVLSSRSEQSHSLWRSFIASVLIALCCFWPRHFNLYLQISRTPTSQFAYYRAAAEWINENRREAESVAAHEIGVLGFFLPDKIIIDQCGIPTKGAAEHMARGDLTWWIREYRPDLVILHPALSFWRAVEGPLREAEWFKRAYRAVAVSVRRGETEGGGPLVEMAGYPGGLPSRGKFEKHAVEVWELVDESLIPRP